MSISLTSASAAPIAATAARAPDSVATIATSPTDFGAMLTLLFESGKPTELPAATVPAEQQTLSEVPLDLAETFDRSADPLWMPGMPLPVSPPGEAFPLTNPETLTPLPYSVTAASETLSAINESPTVTTLPIHPAYAVTTADGRAPREASIVDTRMRPELRAGGRDEKISSDARQLTEPRDWMPHHSPRQARNDAAFFVASGGELLAKATDLPAATPGLTTPKEIFTGEPIGQETPNIAHPPNISPSPTVPKGLELKSHPSSPAWREAFVAQVSLLTAEGVHSAELRLHPRELGPVEIRISITDQQANISFAAPLEETRRAIEDALPRLREVFADAGVQLDQATVGGERGEPAPREQGAGDTAQADGPSQAAEEPDELATDRAILDARISNALVDTYA